MPSAARVRLEKGRTEIRDFYSVHQMSKNDPTLRAKLRVMNKGMVVLVAALWEAFCEDLLAEATELIVAEAPSADALPAALRREIARVIRDNPHELGPWVLADDGWRRVIEERLGEIRLARNRRLNTPNSSNIDALFREGLGITSVAADWEAACHEDGAIKLDEFIALRNAIAHRVDADAELPKVVVKRFINHANALADATERSVEVVVHQAIGRWPWTNLATSLTAS